MAGSGKKPYKVLFNWAKPNPDTGKLVAVSFDDENMPWESLGGGIGRLYAQATTGQEQKAALTINKANKMQFSKGNFLYMDVGCWLGGHQTFGLVCGEDACVCNYGSGGGKSAGKTGNAGLDDFLSLPGVSILFWEKIPAPHPMDPKKMYLILPDMHVPEVPPKDKRPPEPESTVDFSTGMLVPGIKDAKLQDYDAMAKRDLFDSRDSIDAMVKFLGMVMESSAAKQTTLVQIGDMYELWAKRPLLFAPTNENNPDVILKDNTSSAEEIAGWISGTHKLHPALFLAFDHCKAKGMNLLFLYGNHDNYLKRGEVVSKANTATQSSGTGAVPSRAQNISQDNLFIEHGQRCDNYNRDGATSGHENSQTAAEHPITKEFGPVFRTLFVVGAAAHWCVEQKNFGLYVMGHTHTADLRRVEVYHRRETIEYVAGPEYVDVIKTETPLEGASQ